MHADAWPLHLLDLSGACDIQYMIKPPSAMVVEDLGAIGISAREHGLE